MKIEGRVEPVPTPLQLALQRLAVLHEVIHDAHQDDAVAPLSREQLARQLDELDLWIDDLIGILGNRSESRTN